eukprot:COSAG04_NODE_22273_length_357_cov_2.581395_1_plen_57_part_10
MRRDASRACLRSARPSAAGKPCTSFLLRSGLPPLPLGWTKVSNRAVLDWDVSGWGPL